METISIRKENANNRNYGIDLLRLISMLMVVTLHILGNGGLLPISNPLTLKGELIWSIEVLCLCAVNVYAIISGYVGYKSKHKATSIISLSLQVIFFAVIITGIDTIIWLQQGNAFSWKSFFLSLFPSLKDYWYFSAYFCLFFFMPLLNNIIDNVSKKILKLLALFCFLIFCCWGQIYDNSMNLGYGYSVIWLATLYLVGAYFKKYDPLKNLSSLQCFLGYLICILITIASRLVIAFCTKEILGEYRFQNLLVSYTSPTITLAAIFLVYSFLKLNISGKMQKVISFLTPMSFGVYIIHCHPVIFSKMHGIFAWIYDEHILLILLLVIGISLAVFIICLFLDWIRLLLFKLFKVNKFALWIEKVVHKITAFIFKILHIPSEEPSDISS